MVKALTGGRMPVKKKINKRMRIIGVEYPLWVIFI